MLWVGSRAMVGMVIAFYLYLGVIIMSKNTLWDAGTKRLDFGGKSGRMEWVFGGVLTLIIVTALVLTVWVVFFHEKGPVTKAPEDIHLQCLNPQCNNVEIKKFKDMTDEEHMIAHMQPMAGGPGMERPRFKCDKCQSPMGNMKQCPMCNEWYLDPREVSFGNQVDICPKCGKDVAAYWADVRAKREANN